jgi:hypothetical protein
MNMIGRKDSTPHSSVDRGWLQANLSLNVLFVGVNELAAIQRQLCENRHLPLLLVVRQYTQNHEF